MIQSATVKSDVIFLCKSILEKPELEVDTQFSLTRDLSFDSMHLMQFFAGIEDLYPTIILEDWFMAHAGGGRDTIGSIVDYIAQTYVSFAREAA